MSLENVELVRRMCDAFVVGELERALDVLDPEVEWRGTIGGLEEGSVFHGRTEVLEAYSAREQAWESHSAEVQRLIDAGDRVVVFWREKARGRSSRAEVTTDTAAICTVRSDRVVCVQPYMDRSEALKAVGLEE